VNLLVGKYDTCAGGIFNGKLRLAVFSSNTTNCAAEMFALQRLDVLDFERLNV
jgi:hypothetical protein